MIMIVDELVRVGDFVQKKNMTQMCKIEAFEIVMECALFEYKLKCCLAVLALLPVLSTIYSA